MSDVEVKTSSIQGRGVFAAKDIQKGEEILTIDDSHLVADESQLSQEDFEYHADYFDNKIVLMQEPERCINHSCDPDSYIKTIRGVRRVIAIRAIPKGEEITYDYAINSENDGTFPCHCGADRCRRIYQGNFFKLPLLFQLEYLPYLDDWFIQKHHPEVDKLRK